MAEILGAVAAGIPICSQLVITGRAIQRAAERVKNSRCDVEKLANETIIFAGLFRRFLDACKEDEDARSTDAASVYTLIGWAQGVVANLGELLGQVNALDRKLRPRPSLEKIAIARVVWFANKKPVDALRASLSVARESMQGYSNLMFLHKLNEQIKMLKEALIDNTKRSVLEKQLGITLEARIQEVEVDINGMGIVHEENAKTLDAATQKLTVYQSKAQTAGYVPVPKALLDFTEALNEYARDVLPKQRTRRSSRRKVSSAHTPSTVSRTSTNRFQSVPRGPPIPENATAGSSLSSYSNDSSSSSSISGRSSSPRVVLASSVSDLSHISAKATNSIRFQSTSSTLNPGGGLETQRHEFRAREYINDPTGNILSPPIQKQHGPLIKERTIGGHRIRLDSTTFFFNDHQLYLESRHHYDLADRFYEALIVHSSKLDELDQVLEEQYRGRTNRKWFDISGWEVGPTAIKELLE